MINFLNKYNMLQCEDLSTHCTMRVGGKAKYYVEPLTASQLVEIVKQCNKLKIKYFILGNGSNVIFKDKGFDGVVICTKKMSSITVKEDVLIADCGANLYVLNKMAKDSGLGGMEWSYGIPGSCGGALCMNAGAYGGQMQDVVLKAKVFDGKKIKILYNDQLKFGYRNSIVKEKNYIVLKIWIKLKKDEKENIKNKQIKYLNKRRLSQPIETFNSGSIFKKINNLSAGKMIDNLGLKGVIVNGAQISKLHANFIVNLGNAKAKDIQDLINIIKKVAKEKNNIELEEEVLFIGED